MINIKLVRENYDEVKKNYIRRGEPKYIKALENVKKLDEQWRKHKTELQKLQQKRNQTNIKISKSSQSEKKKLIKEMKKIADKIKSEETKQKKLEAKLRIEKLKLPTLLDKSVPKGKDDSDNVEEYKWGKEPKFNFKPKDHLELAEQNRWIDRKRGAKVAGNGFLYIKGDLALLDHTLQRYAIDKLMKKGYIPTEVPNMLTTNAYEISVGLEDFKDVMYEVMPDKLHLIATSESSLAAMHMNEVLQEKDLPLKYCGISTCYRREVGTHGKYTKGLYRMHHFNKVEMFVYCKPEDSWKHFEEMQKVSEEIFKELKLPFKRVNVCTGDLGPKQAKQYDIEGWHVDGEYRERTSCSNCWDWQALRGNIRYETKNRERKYVHTLNNTGMATSRAMISILEVHQQKDGSVKIPKVLQPYMGGKKKIGGK